MWSSVLCNVIILAVLARFYGYRLLIQFFRLICATYFRHIGVDGINNVPREGPAIVCANHPNMLVDALLVVTQIVALGRSPYVWAKGSLFSNWAVAKLLKSLGGVPVYRPPRKELKGYKDKELSPDELKAFLDKMFDHTWKVLALGNVMVLFPEGTSYTSTEMLDLRTGVMRVATGYVKKYDQSIPVIPCGLTYFQKHKFRSEVLVQFGEPILIDQTTITSESFEVDEKKQIKSLTAELQRRMRKLTLNAPDYATLRTGRCFRRIYTTNMRPLKAHEEIAVTSEMIRMLASREERVLAVREEVDQFQHELDDLRISDNDLQFSTSINSSMTVILESLAYLAILVPFGLPGMLLNAPFYYIGHLLNKAAGFQECKSMYKIVVTGFIVPVQWILLVFLSYFFFGRTIAEVTLLLLPLFLYSHIRVVEEGSSTLHAIQSLIYVGLRSKHINTLKSRRKVLYDSVKSIVDTYADPSVLHLLRPVKKLSKKTKFSFRHLSITFT